MRYFASSITFLAYTKTILLIVLVGWCLMEQELIQAQDKNKTEAEEEDKETGKKKRKSTKAQLQDFSDNIQDFTQDADQLVEIANSLLKRVDTLIANEAIDERVGRVLDDRIEKLIGELQYASQETGGYLFTRIDTSINNVFDNVVDLFIEVNTAINDRANTDVINQLSDKLAYQIGLISKESKDNITLTFSNSQFLIDKTTNAVMVVTAVIFLAVGFLIVVYLLTKAELTTFSRLATLMAMSVYMVFFGVMTFFTPFRVALVSGFELRDLNNQPRITGISPKKVSSTNTKTITIQGEYFSSVHKVNALTVRLQQFQLGKTPTTFYKLPTTTQLAFDETQLMLIFPKKGLNLPAGHYQLQIWYEQVLLQSPQLLEVY